MFVKPLNIKQKLFVKSILEDTFDLHIIDARAGSGKTLMVLSKCYETNEIKYII